MPSRIVSGPSTHPRGRRRVPGRAPDNRSGRWTTARHVTRHVTQRPSAGVQTADQPAATPACDRTGLSPPGARVLVPTGRTIVRWVVQPWAADRNSGPGHHIPTAARHSIDDDHAGVVQRVLLAERTVHRRQVRPANSCPDPQYRAVGEQHGTAVLAGFLAQRLDHLRHDAVESGQHLCPIRSTGHRRLQCTTHPFPDRGLVGAGGDVIAEHFQVTGTDLAQSVTHPDGQAASDASGAAVSCARCCDEA